MQLEGWHFLCPSCISDERNGFSSLWGHGKWLVVTSIFFLSSSSSSSSPSSSFALLAVLVNMFALEAILFAHTFREC